MPARLRLSTHEKDPIIEENAKDRAISARIVARGPTGFVLFTHFRGHRLFAVQAWSVGNFEEVSGEAAPKALARPHRGLDRALSCGSLAARGPADPALEVALGHQNGACDSPGPYATVDRWRHVRSALPVTAEAPPARAGRCCRMRPPTSCRCPCAAFVTSCAAAS